MAERNYHLFLAKGGRPFRSATMPESDAWYVHALLEEEAKQGRLRSGTNEAVELALPDGRRLFYLAMESARPSLEESGTATVSNTVERLETVNRPTIRAVLTNDQSVLATDTIDLLAGCSEPGLRQLGQAELPEPARGKAVYTRVWLPDDGCRPLRRFDIDNGLAALIAKHIEGLEQAGKLDQRPGRPIRLELNDLSGVFYYACWERQDPNSPHRKYNEIRVVCVEPGSAPWLGDIARLLGDIQIPSNRQEVEQGDWKPVQVGREEGRPDTPMAAPGSSKTSSGHGRAASRLDEKQPIGRKEPRWTPLRLMGFLGLVLLAGVVLIYAWSTFPTDGGANSQERQSSPKVTDPVIPASIAHAWETFDRDLAEWLAPFDMVPSPADLMARLLERVQRPDLVSSVKWQGDQKESFLKYKTSLKSRNLFLDFINRLPSAGSLPPVENWQEGMSRVRYYRGQIPHLLAALDKAQDSVGLPAPGRKTWPNQWRDDPGPLLSDLKEYIMFERFYDQIKAERIYENHSNSDGEYKWQPAVRAYLREKYP